MIHQEIYTCMCVLSAIAQAVLGKHKFIHSDKVKIIPYGSYKYVSG